MKQKIFYVLIAYLSLGLFSCGNADELIVPQSPSEIIDSTVYNESKAIADLMISIPLTEDVVDEVFTAVSAGLKNGIEESYYFCRCPFRITYKVSFEIK